MTNTMINNPIELADAQKRIETILTADNEAFLLDNKSDHYVEPLKNDKGVPEDLNNYTTRVWAMKQANPTQNFYGIYDDLHITTKGATSANDMQANALEDFEKRTGNIPSYEHVQGAKLGLEFWTLRRFRTR